MEPIQETPKRRWWSWSHVNTGEGPDLIDKKTVITVQAGATLIMGDVHHHHVHGCDLPECPKNREP